MGPALEKLRRCTPLFNPQDEVLKALVELVQRQGWNNSLQDLASSIGALTDDQVKFIIYQIMRGLKYIHSAGIIHRLELYNKTYWTFFFVIIFSL